MRLTVRRRSTSSGSLSINTCDTGRSQRSGDEGFCYLLRCVGRYWHKADNSSNSGHWSIEWGNFAAQRMAAERGMPELPWLSRRFYLYRDPNPGIPCVPHL
jgi:hypothetical protein